MARKKQARCQICEQLRNRRASLGREYSKALAQAFEARGTTRYAVLSETADILHMQFKEVQAELKKHRTTQHPRAVRPRPDPGASPAGGPFKGPNDNNIDVADYFVDQINPASSAAAADTWLTEPLPIG